MVAGQQRSAAAILAIGLLLGLWRIAAGAPEPTLRIGDPAPVLEPMAWIKGGPVEEFEPGHVYVVKFFATWCGACNAAMPHMSELARNYAGELTVIGVNVRETENAEASLAAVTEFVQKKGGDMDYIVAMDDPVENPMFESWMLAGGAYGIPTAFVVGKDGTLTYMGYPTDHRAQYSFQKAVELALAERSDLAAARALQGELSEQTAARLAEVELLQPMRLAQERNDYRSVVVEADKVIAAHPEYNRQLFLDKLTAMLHIDEGEALTFAASQAADHAIREYWAAGNETQFRARIAGAIAGEEGLSRNIYRRAVRYLEQAAAAEPEQIWNWVKLAALQHRLGRVDEAIAAQRQAIAAAATAGDIPDGYIAELHETLSSYQAPVR